MTSFEKRVSNIKTGKLLKSLTPFGGQNNICQNPLQELACSRSEPSEVMSFELRVQSFEKQNPRPEIRFGF